MRPYLAWLLLILTSFQWIGGRLCYKVIYSVEISRQMNEAEMAVAESLMSETGIEAHVQILDRTEINIDGIGYSNFFLFSREMEGETVYYQLNSAPADLVDFELVLDPDGDAQERSPKMALLDRLFSDFTLYDSGLSITPKAVKLPARNFSTPGALEIIPFHPLSPPPEALV